MFKKKRCRHSVMALNRTSDVSAAEWRSQTPVKNLFTFGDTVCLSGGNPYKALQFEKKKNSIFTFSALLHPNTKFWTKIFKYVKKHLRFFSFLLPKYKIHIWWWIAWFQSCEAEFDQATSCVVQQKVQIFEYLISILVMYQRLTDSICWYFSFSDDSKWLSALDDTDWLSQISELLQTATQISVAMENDRSSVLISYEDGIDRTAQVCHCWIDIYSYIYYWPSARSRWLDIGIVLF